jgi:uncharacterized cofD-like protein
VATFRRKNEAFRVDPAATAAFSALRSALPTLRELEPSEKALKAVVIGGGTGAPVSIRTLLSLGVRTNAVVAMADDGGSTGILREEADATPPGDIRKCLLAFAKDPNDPLVRALKYRFSVARDHALGNLLLAALEDTTQSFPEAIAICERLVQAQGHVYPSTLDHVVLSARTLDGTLLCGQAAACHARTALDHVYLQTEHGTTPHAYEPALAAIREADLIVLGPGSLFTSIIPNLVVPGVIDAIRASRGRVVFVCALADIQGETWGLTAREHFEALVHHGMGGLIDYMLVHTPAPLRAERMATGSFQAITGGMIEAAMTTSSGAVPTTLPAVKPISLTYNDMLAIQAQGPVVITRNLVDGEHPTWHSPFALREAFQNIIKMSQARRS